MSAEQINALVESVKALEAAKAKATQLEKEVRYTQNRLARASAEVERLQKEIDAATKAAGHSTPSKDLAKKVG